MEKLKLLNRHELKHDIQFLNMASELRHMAEDGDKQAKKIIKLKMKHEAAYEEMQQKEEDQIQAIIDSKNGAIFNQ